MKLLNSKPFVLLMAFIGLMCFTFLSVEAYSPDFSQGLITVSVPDAPRYNELLAAPVAAIPSDEVREGGL